MGMKAKNSADKKKRKNPFTFIGDLKEELKKVSWTTKTELLSATKVVVISTFAFGIGIYLVDLGVKGVLELVKKTVLFVFG